ncbi:MAG: alanine--glyoxylate aminotransferase family protein [Elusimicrobia bacterium]|nr:alanine--glyoxylate aminotransferase family protein [Elusimicrobiota bacterium]
MSVDSYVLLTPGPTPVPPEVAARSAEPILHHRTHEFQEILTSLREELKKIFLTRGEVLIFSASGTGAMESAVVNLHSPGEEVLVYACGVFGRRWAEIAQAFGLSVRLVEEEWGHPCDPARLASELKKSPSVRAVYLTHTETSTGTLCDLKGLTRSVRESAPEALTVADAISGLGGQELRMEEWGLDGVVSASQKGLMNAPGLAFVALSERAWQRTAQARLGRFYWDYRRVRKFLAEQQTPFTPPVSLIVAQHEAVRMLLERGLENIWRENARMAVAVRSAVEKLGLSIFSRCPCDVLTAAVLPDSVDGQRLVRHLREKYRVSIAGGQAALKGKIIRIAHMGYIRRQDLERGIRALAEALSELGWRGSGDQALQVFRELYVG